MTQDPLGEGQRNETEKIASAMRMTEDHFVARFVNEKS